MTGTPIPPGTGSRPRNQPASRPRWRRLDRRRLIAAAVAAWGVAIVVLAGIGVDHGRPTDREQTTVAAALPTVDRAIGDLARAVDPSQAVLTVSGYQRVDESCEITAVRTGVRYERAVTVYTRPGAEASLLERIAARMPSRYRARVTSLPGRPLRANAGDFVAVRGGTFAPGELRLSADTGCRPGGPVPADPDRRSLADAPAAPRVSVQAALDALHLAAARWAVYRVDCPSRSPLWAVEATTAGSNVPASVTAPLRAARVGDTVLLARPEAYAYRAGPVGAVARKAGGTVTVSATVGCDR